MSLALSNFESIWSSRCGSNLVRLLGAINHYRSDAEAEQAPEPDALHRALQRDVERRVDEDRHYVAGDEQEQIGPWFVSTRAGRQHRSRQHGEPRHEDDRPQHYARNPGARQQCHVHVMRTARWW